MPSTGALSTRAACGLISLPPLPTAFRPAGARSSGRGAAQAATTRLAGVSRARPPAVPATEDAFSSVADDLPLTSLAGARVPDLHLRDQAIDGLDLANLHARGAGLFRSSFSGARLTGATLVQASLRDVAFSGCRMDLASLVAAKLERVTFSDCDLREVPFDEAHLRDVRFERCDLGGTSFSKARLQRVELVDCDLTRVRSVADLRGASMRWGDIIANAGPLAAAVGIAVLDED